MSELASQTSFLAPILVFLAAAVIAVPLFRFAGFGAVIGYLAAGMAIGPSGFRLIADPATTLNIAELGVVLLLFLIGLSLKPARFVAMSRDIGLIGLSQMAICAFLIGAAAEKILGLGRYGAGVAGISLAFSATAIALQLLDERGDGQTEYGRRSFAVLLAQDIAVVPVLALIPLISSRHPALAGSMKEALFSLSQAFAALSFVIIAGHYALNPLFRVLARANAREVMTAAALLIVLGAALLMQSVGMSMALGAFLAGLLLSESNFRHQLEADIEPFRGLLMGLFFMSVGMSVDRHVIAANALLLAGGALAIIILKMAVVFGLFRARGTPWREALKAGGVLTPAGEFSFAIFPLAAAHRLMEPSQANLLAALAALTMVLGPLIAKLSEQFVARWKIAPQTDPGQDSVLELPPDKRGSVLAIGFGRFGQIALQPLLAERIDVTVIDLSVERVRNAGRFGFKVYFGDGARLDVLRAAGAAQARVIAICIDDRASASAIAALAQENFPLARVFARAYDRNHALELIECGVDYQIRETFESALAFGGAALLELKEDPDRAKDVVEAVRRRDLDRFAVQQAGGAPLPLYSAQARLAPEPLTRPIKKSKGLTKESQDIVDTPAN